MHVCVTLVCFLSMKVNSGSYVHNWFCVITRSKLVMPIRPLFVQEIRIKVGWIWKPYPFPVSVLELISSYLYSLANKLLL